MCGFKSNGRIIGSGRAYAAASAKSAKGLSGDNCSQMLAVSPAVNEARVGPYAPYILRSELSSQRGGLWLRYVRKDRELIAK